MGARIVGVNQIHSRSCPQQSPKTQRLNIHLLRGRRLHEWTAWRRQQPRAMSSGDQSTDQVQCLPLPATHLGSRVDVQDKQDYLRGLMFLAFAYLTKLYSAAMCAMASPSVPSRKPRCRT